MLHDGSLINQDHSSSAIELERVLDDTLPLLQAIQPDKLAATLGALATALQGRGEQLGHDLTSFDHYLTALDTQMPTLRADITKLAQVLDSYDGALPDLMAVLRNVTVTATTISNQRNQLAAFLADTTDLGDSTRTFLDHYGDRIIQLGTVSAPVLGLLAAYSPEYPCLLQGLVTLQPQVERSSPAARCTSPSRSPATTAVTSAVATTRCTARTTARTAGDCRTRWYQRRRYRSTTATTTARAAPPRRYR